MHALLRHPFIEVLVQVQVRLKMNDEINHIQIKVRLQYLILSSNLTKGKSINQ